MQDIDEIVHEIERTMSTINRSFEELDHKINIALSKYPIIEQPIVDLFLAEWKACCYSLKLLWEFVLPLLNSLGNPNRLAALSSAWSLQVGAAVTGKATDVSSALLLTDDAWVGSAGEAYASRVSLQTPMMKSISSNWTDHVSSALSHLHSATITYITAVCGALLTFGIAIAAVVVEAGGVVSLPTIPPTIMTAAGVLVTDIAAAYALLRAQGYSAKNDLELAKSDNASLENGKWPKIVSHE